MENLKENRVRCSNCGHQWYKRTEKPLQCPKCTVRTWSKPRDNIVQETKQENKTMEQKQKVILEDEWS